MRPTRIRDLKMLQLSNSTIEVAVANRCKAIATKDRSKKWASSKSLISVVLLIIVLFIGLIKVSAQDNEKVELGIKGGLNTGGTTYNPNSINYGMGGSSWYGFNAGIILDIPLKKFKPNLYLQPGLSWTLKNVEYAGEIGYLEIPVLVSYRYPLNDKLKIYADVGPYFSQKLSSNFNDEWLKKSDAGLVLGAGMKLKKFSLGVQYDLGLTNIANTPDYLMTTKSLKTKLFSINVAFTFSVRSIAKAFANIDTEALYNLGNALNTIGSTMNTGGGNTNYSGGATNSSGSNSGGTGCNCATMQDQYNRIKKWVTDAKELYNDTSRSTHVLDGQNLRNFQKQQQDLEQQARKCGCALN